MQSGISMFFFCTEFKRSVVISKAVQANTFYWRRY